MDADLVQPLAGESLRRPSGRRVHLWLCGLEWKKILKQVQDDEVVGNWNGKSVMKILLRQPADQDDLLLLLSGEWLIGKVPYKKHPPLAGGAAL